MGAVIDRYYDPRTKKETVRIKAGEYYANNKDEHIATVLGSCISACIRDDTCGFGGMNHFMLPKGQDEGSGISESAMYGGFAMESLLNELFKNGARREHLEIKLFGGGNVIKSSSKVGLRNIEFVRGFLLAEGLSVIGEDVGGDHGRSLVYSPTTGRALIKALPKVFTQTIGRQEEVYSESIFQKTSTGTVDLF